MAEDDDPLRCPFCGSTYLVHITGLTPFTVGCLNCAKEIPVRDKIDVAAFRREKEE